MSDGVTFDAASVDRVMRAMSADAYADIVAAALTDMTHLIEGESKALTPVVSGHLRRSEISDLSHVRDGSDPYARVEYRTPYATYIETGETRDGRRRLKTKPGGYRMFEQAHAKAEGLAGRVLDKAKRDIAAKWATP